MSSSTRGAAGRAAFDSKFTDPVEKSEYYRSLSAKGNSNRLVLSGDEAAALGAAYELLRSIAARHAGKLAQYSDSEGSERSA